MQTEPETFDAWFTKGEWFYEEGRRESFGEAWRELAAIGVEGRMIGRVFDIIVGGMRDEYGE